VFLTVVHRWFNWGHFITNQNKLTVKISRLTWASWLQQQRFWFTLGRCLLRIPTRTCANPWLLVVLFCPTNIFHDITTNNATADSVLVFFFISLVNNYSSIGRIIHWTTYTNLLSPWSRVLLEKLTGFSASQ